MQRFVKRVQVWRLGGVLILPWEKSGDFALLDAMLYAGNYEIYTRPNFCNFSGTFIRGRRSIGAEQHAGELSVAGDRGAGTGDEQL